MRRRPPSAKGPARNPGSRLLFWGKHAVIAALNNPDRVVRKLWGTHETIGALGLPDGFPVIYAQASDMGKMVPNDAPHQGLVAEVEPLPDVYLEELLIAGADNDKPLLILDQVTDPHNVGAILRSAAAFNALGVITQDRHAPPESGALAKAAS
jgi:23S rRNA (guanosine2251-2'-O)-methyltransferase